jgi:hypothetical protein
MKIFHCDHRAAETGYRLCRNYKIERICNWAIPAADDNPLCVSCRLIDSWFPVTYVLNNLNRGLGFGDAYPFVLSPSAVDKLRFVDDVVGRARVGGTDRIGDSTEGRATKPQNEPPPASPPVRCIGPVRGPTLAL